MNIDCIICSDLLTSTSDAYITTCGHLFHYYCLIEWFKISETCPQCRSVTSARTIHRVYFTVTNDESLQFQVNRLKRQLSLKETDAIASANKYKRYKTMRNKLRDDIEELKSKDSASTTALNNLKEDVENYRKKIADLKSKHRKTMRDLERYKSLSERRQLENDAKIGKPTVVLETMLPYSIVEEFPTHKEIARVKRQKS